MKTIKLAFLTLSILASAFNMNAQDPVNPRKDPNKTWKRHSSANKKWADGALNKNSDSGQYLSSAYFQDRRAKKWTAGLMAGTSLFYGDADKKQLGFDIAPFVKYSISQTLALRAEYNFATLKGQRDYQNPTLFKDNFKFNLD